MNSNALVTVATFSFPHEAHVAVARLEAVGIPVFIADEYTINMQWLYSNALGGVKVQVPAEFVAKSKEILQEDLSYLLDEEFGKDMLQCPKCGSTDLFPYTKGKKPALIVFLLLGFPLFFYKHGYKCRSCGEFIET
jgi:hypothetical protein